MRILLVVLALLFSAGAQAQTSDTHPYKPEAWAHCQAQIPAALAAFPGFPNAGCTWVSGTQASVTGEAGVNGSYLVFATFTTHHVAEDICPPGTVWEPITNTCKNQDCLNALPSPTLGGYLGATTCTTLPSGEGSMACEFVGQLANPGSGGLEGFVNWFPTGDTCDPEAYECLAGYSKNTQGHCIPDATCENGVPMNPDTGTCENPAVCPQGQHKEPALGQCVPDSDTCPYGQVKGPDGSCVNDDTDNCPTGQAKGSDGTCKPDADDDGTPDAEEDDGTFSGGEDCNTPPACSGDNIMCGQARIQWRIDCNTRKNAEIRGGGCSASDMPICVGDGCDQRQHTLLIMQWRTACAVEGLSRNGGTTEGNDGDANNNGQPDWTENPGDGTGQDLGAPGSPDGVVTEGEEIGADGLDVAGFGWSETCPTIPSVDVMGQTLTFDTSVFCNWLALGGQFVLIAAALLSLRILGGGSSV